MIRTSEKSVENSHRALLEREKKSVPFERPLLLRRFFPREEGEKYFSSIPPPVFRFIRSPAENRHPKIARHWHAIKRRHEFETNPRARRRVERKLHPNRINRGVLAAVDARPSRNASSFCHDFRSNASFFLFSSFRQCDDEIEDCHFFLHQWGKDK